MQEDIIKLHEEEEILADLINVGFQSVYSCMMSLKMRRMTIKYSTQFITLHLTER
jgi:hypothetical protein